MKIPKHNGTINQSRAEQIITSSGSVLKVKRCARAELFAVLKQAKSRFDVLITCFDAFNSLDGSFDEEALKLN